MKMFQIFAFWKVIILASCLALITSCAGTPASDARETEPIVVEFTNWWGDFTLIIAQQQGLFEKYGVKVQPKYYDVFSRAIPDFAAGQIDGGLFAIGDAINVSRHGGAKVVAIYDNGSFNTVVSTPEIFQIDDLEGKRVGVQIGTTYELLINEMLRSAGLSMSDVTLVNITPEEVPANLGKTIDAGFIYEPYTSQALAEGNTLLLKSTQFIGLYPDVIVFRSEIVENRPDDIRAFLKAWFEAVEFRKQNPQQARQIVADYFQTTINEITADNQLEILTLEDNYELFKSNSKIRQPLIQTARLNAEYLVRMGVLSSTPDLEKLLDATYLP